MDAAACPHTLGRRLSILLLGLAVMGTACGGSETPMPPSTTSTLAGRWSGDLFLEAIQTRMTWTLTEDAQRVNGEALILLPSGTVLLNGALVGTLAGTTLDYTITVVPGAIITSLRIICDACQRITEAKCPQNPRCVAADLKAGAHLTEGGGLLE